MERRHETGGKGACLTKVRGAWPGTRIGRRGIGAAWLGNWRQPQDLRNGGAMEATIMNCQVWMSAGSGPSQKDSTGQDPLICLWDGKRDPDTQTGACPTQTDRCWGVEPQAPAVLLDPFVDLSSICRPDHRRDGAQDKPWQDQAGITRTCNWTVRPSERVVTVVVNFRPGMFTTLVPRYLLPKEAKSRQAPGVVLDRGRLALDDLTARLPRAGPRQWEAVGDAKGRGGENARPAQQAVYMLSVRPIGLSKGTSCLPKRGVWSETIGRDKHDNREAGEGRYKASLVHQVYSQETCLYIAVTIWNWDVGDLDTYLLHPCLTL
ncbi:uncharacterized protein B0T23DRAFT_400649 [Neurospora hispaniola]|uniref:Uncharacterized protein n=1 Tax=Neurospora hispaniola TaxID=588809 RepID=A0AAJ0IEK6_9PEZI|nr:hypothetical protein B0T23DRAFT_400649 [Neurospora hispaniola]